ncbi:helix-turn-helix domain-containing protein [Arthrobacter sp. BPSS-3]|uniref:helix-turn-helix domain-containing protein n=1 Tax=Arthrobacter sp. BPSS-3 TaxID=3366580 RepID=UPI0037DD2777
MDNQQPDLAGKILERISTDRAVQEAFQRLLDEMQGFRAEVRELSRAMSDPARQRYLTTAEVAKLFGVSEATVRRRVKDETWPAWRDGRQMRFGPAEIAAIEEWGRPKQPPMPLTPLERRQRNKQLRSVFSGGL